MDANATILKSFSNKRSPLRVFYNNFSKIHPYLAFSICVFGIFSNFCLIAALSRPRMRSTVNRLLISIASVDTILMCSYSIYLAHFKLADRQACPIHLFTYEWALFQIFHASISVYFRACSLWLSVIVAGYGRRVMATLTPIQSENPKLARHLTLGVLVAVFFASTPIFLQNSSIREGPRAPFNDTICPANHSPYFVPRPQDFATPLAGVILSKTAFVTNATILKFFPCLSLAYFLIFLMHSMYAHAKWREEKFQIPKRQSIAESRRESIFNSQISNPTTLILTIVLCTTLVCELPNATLSLICSISTAQFMREVYVNLGDVLDLLSLFNGVSTSILYCFMSRVFRETFFQIFFNRRRSSSSSARNRYGDLSVSAPSMLRSRSASPANLPLYIRTNENWQLDKLIPLISPRKSD